MVEFRLRSRNFIFMCLSSFLYFGSFYLLLPTLPQYVASLGGTVGQIGLVTGMFTLASVVIRPSFGRLADRFGRKKLMLIGAGCFALMFSVYGQIQAVMPLYALRILHGIAHGSYLAAAFAYIADLAPPRRRGEVMGVYGVANVVAMAIFPAIGSSIIAHTGSFSILFVYSAVAAAGGFLSVWFIDEMKPPETGGGKVSLMAILSQRAVVLASFSLFAAATVYGTVITFLPVYAPAQGIANFGVFFTAYALFTLISRIAAGKLSDKYGRRKVILPFMALVASATFLLPILSDVYLLILIGSCFGLGFGACMPTLNAYVVDEATPRKRASALAFFSSFMDVGITMGSVVLGLVAEYLGYGAMFFIGGVLVVISTVVFAVGARSSLAGEQRN